MDVEVIRSDKNETDIATDSVTISEILRVYLNQEGVDFVAWRRDHPSKPVLFTIKSSGKSVSKIVGDAVSAIKKDCDSILSALKK